MRRPLLIAAAVLILVLSAVDRVPAEQAATTQTELLAEVRLLRQAIESLAGTNARVQIVFGRLTLQEQRTATAAKRFDDARTALAKLTQEMAVISERHEGVLESVADSRRKPEEIKQLEQMRAEGERLLKRMEAERARLAGDEADAAAALNQEQGRWSDLNRQLEELERALSKQQ